MRRLLLAVVTLGAALLLASCSGFRSPAAPAAATTIGFGAIQAGSIDARPVDVAACLSGASSASCFSAVSIHARAVRALADATLAPPVNLVAASSGSSVTLTWAAPGGDPPSSYIIEAGSAPGLANLANFSTGAVTTFHATGVGNGTYFVRVRAASAFGVSLPSNEAVLAVAGGSCVAPGPPDGLTLTFNANGVVSFAWTAASGGPVSYIVEAGAQPGLSNLANSDLGNAATSLTATGVGAGVYYVRVRARNSCGIGVPSNEVVVAVGTSTPAPPQVPSPSPTPPAPNPGSCSYTVSPAAIGSPFFGGRFSVAISRTAGSCSWQATANATWISAEGATSGNGNGTLDFLVAANTAIVGRPRAGAITIAWTGGSAQVTVSQAPFEPQLCVYTLAVNGQDHVALPSAGADFTAAVTWIDTGAPMCGWQVLADGFVTLLGPAAGTGSGSVTFHVPANPGPARGAYVGIRFAGGQTSQVLVSQAGTP